MNTKPACAHTDPLGARTAAESQVCPLASHDLGQVIPWLICRTGTPPISELLWGLKGPCLAPRWHSGSVPSLPFSLISLSQRLSTSPVTTSSLFLALLGWKVPAQGALSNLSALRLILSHTFITLPYHTHLRGKIFHGRIWLGQMHPPLSKHLQRPAVYQAYRHTHTHPQP